MYFRVFVAKSSLKEIISVRNYNRGAIRIVRRCEAMFFILIFELSQVQGHVFIEFSLNYRVELAPKWRRKCRNESEKRAGNKENANNT